MRAHLQRHAQKVDRLGLPPEHLPQVAAFAELDDEAEPGGAGSGGNHTSRGPMAEEGEGPNENSAAR